MSGSRGGEGQPAAAPRSAPLLPYCTARSASSLQLNPSFPSPPYTHTYNPYSILYKLDELVRPYVHKVLVVIEPLLIDEDYYARVEGREIIANLAKAAGLAQMIAAMRPDIDNVDEYVRNTTARAFSVVASALGIPALLPFLKAVCLSKKSWQARHTGAKIVQQIAILLGCAVLPHLKALVDIIKGGLTDENQKVKTITALALAALAEAATPYGIESFDDVLEPLWRGIRSLRGKVLAAFLKAIGFVIPLMDAEHAFYYTGAMMVVLKREFATPDEEMKKIVLKVRLVCFSCCCCCCCSPLLAAARGGMWRVWGEGRLAPRALAPAARPRPGLQRPVSPPFFLRPTPPINHRQRATKTGGQAVRVHRRSGLGVHPHRGAARLFPALLEPQDGAGPPQLQGAGGDDGGDRQQGARAPDAAAFLGGLWRSWGRGCALPAARSRADRSALLSAHTPHTPRPTHLTLTTPQTPNPPSNPPKPTNPTRHRHPRTHSKTTKTNNRSAAPRSCRAWWRT